MATNERRDEVLKLFLQHQAMLAGFLFTLVRDWDLVEEALQETAVFLCGRWQEYAPGTNFGAWARTLARMRCRELLHQKRRAAAKELDLDAHNVPESITEEEWDAFAPSHTGRQAALRQCVQALPESERKLVEWRYHEQMPCDRIAKRLARSVEAVYMSLSRIRKRLRQCVEFQLAREMS